MTPTTRPREGTKWIGYDVIKGGCCRNGAALLLFHPQVVARAWFLSSFSVLSSTFILTLFPHAMRRAELVNCAEEDSIMGSNFNLHKLPTEQPVKSLWLKTLGHVRSQDCLSAHSIPSHTIPKASPDREREVNSSRWPACLCKQAVPLLHFYGKEAARQIQASCCFPFCETSLTFIFVRMMVDVANLSKMEPFRSIALGTVHSKCSSLNDAFHPLTNWLRAPQHLFAVQVIVK